ncbi:hypothetical protein WN48_09283 [Eufriesea mexicana]|uniref:Uncharacterized protein n=1 Tax=Eufriesea mexicana TaxID=516756 RepID=A0A310SFF1_9HYME|nr:hypothetical protein WN48_09283 [Eufriesea mexicana]
MEKRDTKTGMRSNEVNVRKLQQPGRRMSWNFGERVYRVSLTHACTSEKRLWNMDEGSQRGEERR